MAVCCLAGLPAGEQAQHHWDGVRVQHGQMATCMATTKKKPKEMNMLLFLCCSLPVPVQAI